jgi:exodeoxyribonuclease-5
MKEVMRQALDSPVLYAATMLRKKIEENSVAPPYFFKKNFKNDIEIIERADVFEEYLQEAFYGYDNNDKSIIVCRTNKRANMFNKQVRQRILQRENVLEAGDKIMIVKNNYYWLDDQSRAGFIANGVIAEISRVVKTEKLYGFNFAEAEIRLSDYPGQKEINVKLLLDTLDAESPALPREKQNLLFTNVMEDYAGIPSYKKRLASVQKNPYYNALQIKFAYAMTCHKTQGGQWPFIFIDQGYLNDEMLNREFLRWLYTAVTRSTQKVFLVNFNPEFFA